VVTGPLSTGFFGTYLVDVFRNPNAQFHFRERKREHSRAVLEYSFDVPMEVSHYGVKVGDEWKTYTSPPASISIPAGVLVTLALLNPIASESAAAGDPVSAKVVQAVRSKDSSVILIPVGAIAHGCKIKGGGSGRRRDKLGGRAIGQPSVEPWSSRWAFRCTKALPGSCTTPPIAASRSTLRRTTTKGLEAVRQT
jgi:hypothetical protein